MYRAVAAKVIRLGIDPEDSDAVLALLPATRVELRRDNAALQVILDGENVTGEIRSAAVTRAVSPVSSIPGVRAAMVREQRRLGADGGVDLKIFLVAGILARAARRRRELEQHGTPPSLEVVVRELEERDRLDSTRSTSPLRKADDAVELDTSAMTIEEQVEEVVRRAKRIMAERGQR
jgi:cytidylate kinase